MTPPARPDGTGSQEAKHPAAPAWTRALRQRLRTLWFVKMIGTTAGIYGFFVLYFWVLRARGAEAVTVPMMAIDRWIAVSELAMLPYGSLWVYVSLAPALVGSAAGLRMYAGGAAIMAGLGIATYWLFPTTTPAFGVDWSAYPALHVLKATDLGGNAFPSLHVAFAAHTAVVIATELRSLDAPRWLRGANWAWCAAIVYSTLATRQHVVIDVAGGLVLTAVTLWICNTRAARTLLGVGQPPLSTPAAGSR